MPQTQTTNTSGFTLIELSIVLVIIGLIIGGILTGQDLINAATIRAQISQIEKYNTAVNTFRNKYGYIPGDIPDPIASNFGFQARGLYGGEGDGNGVLQSNWGDAAADVVNAYQCNGETVVFWRDLATAGLISNKLSLVNSTQSYLATNQPASLILPPAIIGQSSYVYSYDYGGTNYFGVNAFTYPCDGSNNVSPSPLPSISPIQAYSIDAKVDDGLPQTGSVLALYPKTYDIIWVGVYPGSSASPSPTSCYDNSGNASNTMRYSLGSTARPNSLNCALAFRFN